MKKFDLKFHITKAIKRAISSELREEGITVIIRKVQTDSSEYFAKVSGYTYQGFKCSLFRLFWGIPIKVHEEIFIRKLSNNASEMIADTVFKYESSKLTG